MKENKIGGIPIVDNNKVLVGILTNRDLRFEDNKRRKVSEVMTPKEKLVTAPEGTDLKKAEKILQKFKIEKLPVVNKQGKLIGLITYRDILQLSSYPNAVKDSYGRLLVGAALGITKDLLDRAAALQQIGVDVVTLDSAHGHHIGVINALKTLKKSFKNLQVIAGNIGTASGAKALADAGADAVKVGYRTGIHLHHPYRGRRRCTPDHRCHGSGIRLNARNIPVIADGGIRYTGDMVKALAAGANVPS
jgi:IMP dehydrogenase